jgi:hypothetical protein
LPPAANLEHIQVRCAKRDFTLTPAGEGKVR